MSRKKQKDGFIAENLSGITLKNNVQFSITERKTKAIDFFACVLASLGFLGFCNAFLSMMQIPCYFWILLFLPLLVCILRKLPYFHITSALCEILVILIDQRATMSYLRSQMTTYQLERENITALRWQYDHIVNGILYMSNRICQAINQDDSEYFMLPSRFLEELNEKKCITFCLVFFLIPFAILMIEWMTSKKTKSFLIPFLITFIPIGIGLYFDLVPPYFSMLILIAFWVGCYGKSTYFIQFYAPKKEQSNAFVLENDHLYIQSIHKLAQQKNVSVICMLMTASVLLLTWAGIRLSGYERSEKIDEFRSEVLNTIEDFDNSELSRKLQKLSIELGFQQQGKSDIIPLNSAGNRTINNQTMLLVNTEYSVDYPLYFRGSYSAYYDGSYWETLPDSVYHKNEKLFGKISDSGYFPQTYEIYTMREAGFIHSDSYEITVTPKKDTSGYIYIDYSGVAGFNVQYDNLFTDNIDENGSYRYNSYNLSDYGSSFFYLETLLHKDYSLLLEPAQEAEAEYQKFVRENYLSLPDSNAMKNLKEIYGSYTPKSSDAYQAKCETILYLKNQIQQSATYTLNPGITPSNSDFVEYFLTENHKGYCMHFASAGVILCRMYGIPARYVTGYIAPTDLARENKDGTYSYKITDKYAHAWTEVYFDSIGWVPVDFTPSSVYEPDPAVTTTKRVTTTRTTTTTVRTTRATVPGSRTIGSTPAHTTGIEVITKPSEHASSFSLAVLAENLLIALVLLLIIATPWLRAYFLTAHRRKKLYQKDYNQAMLYAYTYLLELLQYRGMEMGNMHPTEFAEYLSEKESLIEKTDILLLCELGEKARFSQHPVSAEEIRLARKLLFQYADEIYKSCGRVEKIFFRYLHVLCYRWKERKGKE